MYAQPDNSSPEIAEAAELEISLLNSWRRTTDAASREPAALRSAIRLLGEAGRALSVNKNDARKFIVRAAALLQAESDSRDHILEDASGAARCRLAPWQIKRVMRFIDANLSAKVGPQDLADLVQLSTSHFTRAFRSTVGKSPYSYLIHRRIERAKEIMLETDLPLVQIALDCGLADQAHLTRLFTRIVGISPAAWRRIHVPRPTGRQKPPAGPSVRRHFVAKTDRGEARELAPSQ
jgi:AraC-like DNA-binding protein